VKNNILKLEVSNSGYWYEKEETEISSGTGTGLKNVKSRLENVFPKKHKFNIVKSDCAVSIKIEFESKLDKS